MPLRRIRSGHFVTAMLRPSRNNLDATFMVSFSAQELAPFRAVVQFQTRLPVARGTTSSR